MEFVFYVRIQILMKILSFAIVIAIETDEIIKPTMTFEYPYYEGSYSVDKQLNTPKIALITGSPTNAQFKLSGDNAAFFTATSEDGISVTIEVMTSLTEDFLSENAYIIIVLEAKAANALDGLTIINIAISKKEDSPKNLLIFQKPLYQGTYSTSNELVLEPAILSDEFSSTVSVSLSLDFEEYFTTEVIESTVTIGLSKELPSDILDSYSELYIVLEAQVEGAINGYTIISIALPHHEDGSKTFLKFEMNFYVAEYLIDNTLMIPLIKLTKEVPGVEFQMLGDIANHFIISQDGSSVNIDLKETFTDCVFNSKYVILVIEAKADGAVNCHTAIYITKIEIRNPRITFQSPYYQASYSADYQLNTPKISLTELYSDAQFELSGDNAAFFAATSEDGISVTMEMRKPLTEDILSKNSYIVIVLKAKAADAVDGLTIVNIALPEEEKYYWEEPPMQNINPRPEVSYINYYADKYILEHTINMHEEIEGEVIIGIFNYKGSIAPVIVDGMNLKHLGAEIRGGVEIDGNRWYLIIKYRQDFELGIKVLTVGCEIPNDERKIYVNIILRLINIDDNAPVITGGTCQVPDNAHSTDCVYEVNDADGYLSYNNMQISIVPRAGAAEDTIFGTDIESIGPPGEPVSMTVRLTALVELDYDLARLFIFSIAANDSINEGRVTAVVQITPPIPF